MATATGAETAGATETAITCASRSRSSPTAIPTRSPSSCAPGCRRTELDAERSERAGRPGAARVHGGAPTGCTEGGCADGRPRLRARGQRDEALGGGGDREPLPRDGPPQLGWLGDDRFGLHRTGGRRRRWGERERRRRLCARRDRAGARARAGGRSGGTVGRRG